MMRLRLAAFATLLMLALLPTGSAWAYPTKTVRIVVPYPAGGTPDILARLVAAELTKRLGQSVVVDNKSGASGIIGTETVGNAAPDGYTLMMGSVQTHGMNPSAFRTLPYDAINGFTPIVQVAETANILVANPSFPAKTVADLVRIAKEKPNSVSFGSPSAGSSPHLAGELFKLRAGIEMTHIPYRGSAPMLNDLLGGHLPIAFDNLPASMPHIRSGALRPLAITTATRAPALPDLPTFQEAGIANYEIGSWFGLFGPAKMPAEVTALLNKEVVDLLKTPEMQAKLSEMGAVPVGSTSAAFAEKVKTEVAKFGEIVKASGMEQQ